MFLRTFSLLISLLFLLSSQLFSEQIDIRSDRARDLIREAYKEHRKERKKRKQTPPRYTDEFKLGVIESSPCINCDDILDLSRSVAEVLEHMGEQLPHEHQQKIQELVAVNVYTQRVDELNEGGCHEARIFGLTDEIQKYDIDQALVLHSQEIDLKHLISFRMRGKSDKFQTIYLRGQGEDSNQLIRVDMRAELLPLVTIYQLEEDAHARVEHALQKDKVFASLPDLSAVDPPETLRPQARFDLEDNKSSEQSLENEENEENEEEENLRYFEYEADSHGLPKKMTLIEFSHESEISEDFKIKNDLEISTSDQELITEITDQSGRQYARFILDKDAQVKAVVPLRLQAFDTPISGEIEVDDKGVTGYMNLGNSSSSKTRLGHTSSIGLTTLEHTRQINSYSDLTLRLTQGGRGSFEQQTITLNYRIVLD